MSMNLSYRRVTSRFLAALVRDPALASAAVDVTDDEATTLPASIRAMAEEMPVEMREELLANVAIQLKNSGAADHFSRAATEAKRKLDAVGLKSSDVEAVLTIGKAWHALHFLLAGTTDEPTDGAGSAVLGGNEVGDDVGYGPARVLDAAETTQISAALNSIDPDSLLTSSNAAAFGNVELYGGFDLANRDDAAELIDVLKRVMSYYRSAAERGDGMLIYLT